jgi:hypothetical protein
VILLVACGFVGAAQRVAILWHDPQWLLTRYGSDDLFYYTEVARHLRSGEGLSFDGLHATSGVQPLWVACLTPWARLFDGHPGAALHGDLALVTALTMISGFLMPSMVRWLLADPIGSGPPGDTRARTLGTLAGCLWLVHPRILSVTFEGTEGALAALCWQLSIMAWSAERSRGRSVRLGVALGVGTLARIDHLALTAALLLWPRCARRSWGRTAAIVTPVIALWGSWLLVCVFTTGSFLPDSGVAKRLASERLSALDLPVTSGDWSTLRRELVLDWPVLRSVGSTVFYAAGHTSRFSIASTLLVTIVLGFAIRRGFESMPALASWPSAFARAAPTATAMACAAWPALVAATSILAPYIFFLHHLRTWYAMPAQLAMTLVGSALCLDVLRAVAPARAAWGRSELLVATCAIWLSAAWTEEALSTRRSWHRAYWVAAQTLLSVTPPGARIGALNAGIFGAFASAGGRRVIDLDGVVNHSVLPALESRTLPTYIDDERIDFVADYVGTIGIAERMFGPGLLERLDPLVTVPIEGHPGQAIGIWRVRARP